MTGLHLTAGDLERFRAAQQALLSPLEQGDFTEWKLGANRAVRRFLGADHSAFSLPTDTSPEVVSEDIDSDFPERFHSYCIGVFSGEYRFRDPYIQKAVAVRRAGGTGAYHQRMFCSPEEVQRSPAYNELFRPTGLVHMIGMSVPMPVGEATQFFSFEGAAGEECSETGLERLRLLIPAFEAGVRIHRRLAALRETLVSLLDRLDQAVAIYSTSGTSLYRSHALQRLLADEPDLHDELGRNADAIAKAMAGRWLGRRKSGRQGQPTDMRACVRIRGSEYRIVGSYLSGDLFGVEGVLVLVERVRPAIPSEEHLQSGFGLTPRESQIALMMAEGLTDGAIAERLVISPHTARRHSENILKKLELGSRAAIGLALLRGGEER